jgi:2,3-bisphosphoglycerate-independent phosphoglycerate mutase
MYNNIRGCDEMKPIVLAILDGVGLRDESHGNAFMQASKPNYDFLWNEYPHSSLDAAGPLVGLPEGQMGNSEVGHLNIGAGRIVYQPLQLINESIKDKTLFSNKEILDVIKHVKVNNSKLHIIGLLSDGGVHSRIEHCIALLKLAKEEGISNVYIHIITDGRDTPPDSALKYIEQLESSIKEYEIGTIADIVGRYYAMDRDNNFDRIKRAYDLYTQSIGKHYDNPLDAINDNYSNGIYDEFLEPCILDYTGKMEENDGIIWFNYRPDRAREIFYAITNPHFDKFEREFIKNIKLVTMMPVSEDVICTNAYRLDDLKNTFGEYISNLGVKQLRIAETEKYAHVTYFFDGGIEKDLKNCDRILIPSPKVATYDMKPDMSCNEITDKLLEVIDNYDVVILNYANGDMLGHTGVMEAAIKAVEVVDENLGRLYERVEALGGLLIVTADHGNCEYMLDDNNNVVTSHTTNRVPFIICNKNIKVKDGKLGDIAPTMLKLIGIEIPNEMTGNILID